MGFPDEVYVTLSSNVEMVRFFSVEQYSGDTPYDPMITIGELTTFYNLTLLLPVKPYTENSPKKEECAYLPSFYQMIYHKIKFVEREVLEQRAKHREKMRTFTDFIIDFLRKWPPTDDNMIISVKLDELKEHLIKDPVEVDQLIKKHNFYLSLINSVNNSLSTKAMVEEELRTVVDIISKTIDERTSFFPIHELQHKFERLFMHPLLPYSTRFEEIVLSFQTLDSQLFLKTLFSIIPPFLNDLGINKKPYDSALVLLLIRFLFDRIYEQNPFIFKEGEDLLHDLVNITFAQLNPPAEFSPPVEDRNTRIIDVFAYDEHFGQGVPPLQEMLFCTNPFDILDCVDKSLFSIEKAATVYNNYQTMVFPFEVTFELFMAVAIASQVSNWENMSVFVENYTPLSGLCPSFEFSKAKVVASTMQFQVMVAEMKGEAPKGDIDDKAKKATEYAANYSESIADYVSNGIVTLPEIQIIQEDEEEQKEEKGEITNNEEEAIPDTTNNYEQNETANENINNDEESNISNDQEQTVNENSDNQNNNEDTNDNNNQTEKEITNEETNTEKDNNDDVTEYLNMEKDNKQDTNEPVPE